MMSSKRNKEEEYWIKRSEAILLEGEQKAEVFEKKLEEAYIQATERIQKELESFLFRYAKENKISLGDVRKRLNPQELKSFQERQKIYLSEIQCIKNTTAIQEYRDYLDELSAKAYITRLEELKCNIRREVELLMAKYNDEAGNLLEEVYEDSFYKHMYDVVCRTKVIRSFTPLSKQMIFQAVQMRWLGSNYADSIWDGKKKLLIELLEQRVPQEFILGHGSRVLAKEVSAKVHVSFKNARRLIRTEVNYVSNQAAHRAYKEAGLEKYEYLATLDERTSDICQSLDRKIFSVKEAMVGVNYPPMHPFCRSTTVPYFEEGSVKDKERVARDKKGKSYYVEERIAYEDWVQEYASEGYAKQVQERLKEYARMNK